MNYKFKRNLVNLKIASASASLIIMLSGCQFNRGVDIDSEITTSTTLDTSGYVVQQTNNSSDELNVTSESNLSNLDETFVSESSLETQNLSCPIEYDMDMLTGFGQFMDENGYSLDNFNLPYDLGYDNPKLQELLENYCYNLTGQQLDNVSIDSFQYFQYYGGTSPYLGYSGSSISDYDYYADPYLYQPELGSLRNAVLIETNSRFLIDEIPYSYFEQRFPEFVSDLSAENQLSIINDYVSIMGRIYDETTNTFNMSDLTDYEYDVVLYYTCQTYNEIRFLISYNQEIRQVRDISTGRNVLAPNELQQAALNNHFGVVVGGDVTQVETREHFYETYGMYPEDALYRETRYEGNLTESNSMYSENPSRQR